MNKSLKTFKALDLKILNSMIDRENKFKIEKKDGVICVYYATNNGEYNLIGMGRTLTEALIAADGIGQEENLEDNISEINDNSLLGNSLNFGGVIYITGSNKAVSSYLQLNTKQVVHGHHSVSDSIENTFVKIEKWLQLNNIKNGVLGFKDKEKTNKANPEDNMSKMLSNLDKLVKEGCEVRIIKNDTEFLASVGRIVTNNNRKIFYPIALTSAASPTEVLLKANKLPMEKASQVYELDQKDILGLTMGNDSLVRISSIDGLIFVTLKGVARGSGISYTTVASNVAETVIRLYNLIKADDYAISEQFIQRRSAREKVI